MKKSIDFLIILLMTVTSLGAVDKIEKKLDEVVLQHKKVFEVPGVAVGILKDDKVLYAKGFGVRSLKTDEPLTTRSLFHMASVSKPFVATAIMQLVEKGKVKLEGKLKDYLPYFEMDDERYKDITIGQMLSHISGMPDVEDYEWYNPQYDDGAAERYIRSLAKKKLIAEPGKTFSYSNMAFDILADVIARASGMTFEAYMKKNIFKPLEMKDSTFYKPEVPKELATAPHVVGDLMEFDVVVSKIYPYNRFHAPSSTLHSNVMDMFNWAAANFNKGEFKGRRILKADTHERLWKEHVKISWRTAARAVGLSWFIGMYRGHKVISHGGGDVGYRTFFCLLPEQSIAVVTLGNSDTFGSREVAFAVLDVILGHEPEKPKLPIFIPVGRMISKKGVKAAIDLYYRLKKSESANYNFRELSLNRLGYLLMGKNRVDDAIEIFKLNVAEYPKAWNVYDSLGEAYLKKGNKAQALVNYQKAVELNPRKESREKNAYTNQLEILKKLKEEK